MAKIVRFADGTFGIRRLTLFGYAYLDLVSPCFWWSRTDRFIHDCHGSKKAAQRAYNYVYDKGTPYDQNTQLHTSDERLSEAYRAGFLEACNWTGPVIQDIESPAFEHALRRFITELQGKNNG